MSNSKFLTIRFVAGLAVLRILRIVGGKYDWLDHAVPP